MPIAIVSSAVTSHRRLRPAASRPHGGASSMLRLARGGDGRLPSGAALTDWAERAAAMLDLTPMMVGTPVAIEAPTASFAPSAPLPRRTGARA
jgi:hypothetical protein